MNVLYTFLEGEFSNFYYLYSKLKQKNSAKKVAVFESKTLILTC